MEHSLNENKKDTLTSIIQNNSLNTLIQPLTREIYLLRTAIAGTSYLETHEFLSKLRAGDEVVLQREPKNRYDSLAILILDKEGHKLGYVPRVDNKVLAHLMDAGKMLTARVTYSQFEKEEADNAFDDLPDDTEDESDDENSDTNSNFGITIEYTSADRAKKSTAYERHVRWVKMKIKICMIDF